MWEGLKRGDTIGEVAASIPTGENVEYFLRTNDTTSFVSIVRFVSSSHILLIRVNVTHHLKKAKFHK